jgi:thymidylate kinase
MLDLSGKLITALNYHVIDYCHWKNNHDLEKGLSGKDDLDLLVSRQHYSRFLQLILSLGFKEAYNRNNNIPFIFHFYGLDSETGTLIHLHVHLNIITGESHTKNYHLPMEKLIMDNSIFHSSGCKIPCPEVELIIFILRYYIKISCLPGALLIWKRRRAFGNEFAHIYRNINHDKVNSLLKTYVKFIPVDFFTEMCRGYVGNRNVLFKVCIGLKLRQAISPFCRFSVISSFIARYSQIVYRFINKFITGEKKILASGGAIIAITGLDATGKSTVSDKIHHWLGKEFTTRYLHVGRPKARLETLWFRPVLIMKKLLKLELQTVKTTTYEHSIEPASHDTHKQNIIYALRYLILGYERYQLLKYANRLLAKGYIIVCDRYPSINVGKMDSPRISEVNESYSLIGLMGRIERKLYNAIPVPDAIFNLRIPIDIALQRNRARVKSDKETDVQLQKRYRENSGLHYEARHFEIVDTTQDLQTVLKELTGKIWAII